MPESPRSADEYGSVSPSFHWEKKRPSLRVKLQKMVGASAMRRLGRKHQRYSESMSGEQSLSSLSLLFVVVVAVVVVVVVDPSKTLFC